MKTLSPMIAGATEKQVEQWRRTLFGDDLYSATDDSPDIHRKPLFFAPTNVAKGAP
jgi:hypothetical protein